jgi:hypothetical protein
LGVAAPFCSGGIARSATKPSDLAIQGEQGNIGSGWQANNTQEGDYQDSWLNYTLNCGFWQGRTSENRE